MQIHDQLLEYRVNSGTLVIHDCISTLSTCDQQAESRLAWVPSWDSLINNQAHMLGKMYLPHTIEFVKVLQGDPMRAAFGCSLYGFSKGF